MQQLLDFLCSGLEARSNIWAGLLWAEASRLNYRRFVQLEPAVSHFTHLNPPAAQYWTSPTVTVTVIGSARSQARQIQIKQTSELSLQAEVSYQIHLKFRRQIADKERTSDNGRGVGLDRMPITCSARKDNSQHGASVSSRDNKFTLCVRNQ